MDFFSSHLKSNTNDITDVKVHSTGMFPTSTGAVHKTLTFSCAFMLVQVNNCVVVCSSDLQKWESGDGCWSSSILLKYESSRGHLFVMSWARV